MSGKRAIAKPATAAAAAAGLLLWGILAFFHPARALLGYLFAYIYWSGIALGAAGVLALHGLVGGRWGEVARRPLEAAALSIVPLAVLFLPIAIGLRHLYPWAAAPPAALELPDASGGRAWLDPAFFLARGVFYLASWIVCAFVLGRVSRAEDVEKQRPIAFRRASAPILIAIFLTGTFAAVDWVLSLEPHVRSTVYGFVLLAGDGLGALALVTVISLRGHDAGQPEPPVQDLGNLLLAFVMLWAYVSFSQFIIVWSGDQPEASAWFVRRSTHGWLPVGLTWIVTQFALPFLLLLSARAKRTAWAMIAVSVTILAAHAVEVYWLVAPASRQAPVAPLPELAGFVGLGGVCLLCLLFVLDRAPRPARHSSHA